MIYNYLKNISKSKFRTKLMISSIIILLISIAYLGFEFYYQLMQYEEIGKNYTTVFWTNTYASLISMGVSFCFIFLCVVITNLIIISRLKRFFIEEQKQPVRLPNYSIAFIIAVIGAVMTKATLYQHALVFLKACMFYIKDPIFHMDISYYFFQRPFLIALGEFISGTWLVIIIYTIAYYIVAINNVFKAVSIESLKRFGVYTHNLVNIAIFFIMVAASYRFSAESILYSKHGNIIGAGYTAVNIWLKIYTAAPFVLGFIVILSTIFLIKSYYRRAIYTMLVFPAFWLIGAILALFIQVMLVQPNEITKEKKYIEQNMYFTKYAYNVLDKLQERDFSLNDFINKDRIENNKILINNVKLTDYTATMDAQKQLQATKGFYKFVDTDISVYNINNVPTCVYTAARELDKEKIEEKTYVNKTYRYTHGYGMVMSSVFNLNKNRQPDFVIRDIPSQSSVGAPQITRPQIYYGEMNKSNDVSKEHIIVNAANYKELDYIQGNEEKESTYTGQSGINLTPLNKVILSIKLGDPRLLFSKNITSNSKALINRNIISRAKIIAPFLDIDNDPYMIVNDEGKLLWIIDAYTESTYFPYSQPSVFNVENQNKLKNKGNYIRNSVKIVVDAYDGSMKFYIVDRQDPIIKTYENIYPDIFEKTAMPSDVARHLKYPERLLKVQAEILGKYHVTDVSDFITDEDNWEVATHLGEGKQKEMQPFYLLYNSLENNQPELVLMLPYTPMNRTKMSAWITARYDLYNGGRLSITHVPESDLIYGPMQVEGQIDQEPEVIKVIDSFNKSGVKVRRGDMVILPLEDEKGGTLLYIEPLYISADNETSVPQLKKVIASYQGKVFIDDSLDKVLEKILAAFPITDEQAGQISGNASLLENAIKVYSEAKKYLSAGDWENYGKKMKEFDIIMKELSKSKTAIR